MAAYVADFYVDFIKDENDQLISTEVLDYSNPVYCWMWLFLREEAAQWSSRKEKP